jgi:hypothetical protein
MSQSNYIIPVVQDMANRELDIITNLIKVQNNKINYTLNKKTKTQEEQYLENLYVQRQAIQDYIKNL